MRRLIQALRSRLFNGDIVTLRETGKLHFIEKVGKHPNGRAFVVINVEGFSNSFTTTLPDRLFKERKLTFRNEIKRLSERGSILDLKKVLTLEERCRNRNLSYLYDEMIASKDTEQFKFNMQLVNRMLDGDNKS